MEKIILQLGEMTWSKVVAAGLIVMGLYWALYYDDGTSVDENIKALQQQYTSAERNLRETRQAMADAEKFEKEVRNNEIQFEKVLEYLPQEINANELTRMTNDLARQTDTTVIATKAQQNQERKDFYEMTRLEFELKGGFPNAVTFLSALSRVPKLLTLDKIEIKIDQATGADTAPSVQLSGVLVGYRYLKDAEIDTQGTAPAAAPAPAPGGPSGTNP